MQYMACSGQPMSHGVQVSLCHMVFRSAYVTWPTSPSCTRAQGSLQVMVHVQL
jgi:hypothetical protein